jgi:glycosyltransferase involved in cell wall biosynthesis
MKLLLIKAGKAFNTIKRDGLIRGGKRVMTAFLALFGRVKPGDILFITGGVGDSARYRTEHHAEELELQGFKCSITVQDNPLLTKYSNKFKIFVFHRVLFTPAVQKLIEKIKQQNKEIIFETDDLVYDPKYLKYMDYFKNMNIFEKKLYENGVGGEILNDDYVKVCTTTTSFLAEKLREFNKKVFIVPNKLSRGDVEIADKVLENISEKNKEEIKIGYFSGTISHNKDFAVAVDALMEIMEKNSQVRLVLVGPLDVKSELVKKFGSRIERSPFVSWEKHLANIAGVDINLAPLEVGNPFCEAKSELKIFEAGIMKVPTVASSTQTAREAIEDGVDGFVASNTEEWAEKTSRLVENSDLRKQMGEKAREKTLARHTNQMADNQKYYQYLKTKV